MNAALVVAEQLATGLDANGPDVLTTARRAPQIDDETMGAARREAFATIAALGGKG